MEQSKIIDMLETYQPVVGLAGHGGRGRRRDTWRAAIGRGEVADMSGHGVDVSGGAMRKKTRVRGKSSANFGGGGLFIDSGS